MLNSFLFYYGLPYYNKLKEVYNNLLSYVYQTYDNIQFGLNSDTLVFYNNYEAPFFEYFCKNNLNVKVWKYDRYNKLFYNYNCALKDTKRFPLLSASIGILSNEQFVPLYNLDEFIDTVSIESSNHGYPNLTQFIYAYMYSNNIFFDKSKGYYIQYLDTSANEFTKQLFVDDFDFCNEKK